MSLSNDLVPVQNNVILRWVPMVARKLRSSAAWFQDGKTDPFVIRGTGNKQRTEGKLVNSIQPSTRKSFGEIDRVAFSFERHGVFVHKGVGRGYKMTGKKVVRYAKGKPNPERYAVEWFNPILDKTVPLLADEIALINADAAVNATRMKI